MDEVIEAGQKHKDKLNAIKVIAEEQKQKISILREEKYKLQDEIDQFEVREQTKHVKVMNTYKKNINLNVEVKQLEKELKENDTMTNREKATVLELKVESLIRKNTDLQNEVLEKGLEILKLSNVVENLNDR